MGYAGLTMVTSNPSAWICQAGHGALLPLAIILGTEPEMLIRPPSNVQPVTPTGLPWGDGAPRLGGGWLADPGGVLTELGEAAPAPGGNLTARWYYLVMPLRVAGCPRATGRAAPVAAGTALS